MKETYKYECFLSPWPLAYTSQDLQSHLHFRGHIFLPKQPTKTDYAWYPSYKRARVALTRYDMQ